MSPAVPLKKYPSRAYLKPPHFTFPKKTSTRSSFLNYKSPLVRLPPIHAVILSTIPVIISLFILVKQSAG